MINHVQFPKLGIELTINRVAFTIGGFDIYWYGIIFACTILIGATMALHLGKKLGINEDHFIDVIMRGKILSVIPKIQRRLLHSVEMSFIFSIIMIIKPQQIRCI